MRLIITIAMITFFALWRGNAEPHYSRDATVQYWDGICRIVQDEELHWMLPVYGAPVDSKRRNSLVGSAELTAEGLLNSEIAAITSRRASAQYQQDAVSVRALPGVGVDAELLDLGVRLADWYDRMAAAAAAIDQAMIAGRNQINRVATFTGALEVYGAEIARLLKLADRIPGAQDTLDEMDRVNVESKRLEQLRKDLMTERDRLRSSTHAVRAAIAVTHGIELQARIPAGPTRPVVVSEYMTISGGGFFRNSVIKLKCELKNGGKSGECRLAVFDPNTKEWCTSATSVHLAEGASVQLEFPADNLPEAGKWEYVIEVQ
jgi:hypothetical protein